MDRGTEKIWLEKHNFEFPYYHDEFNTDNNNLFDSFILQNIFTKTKLIVLKCKL